MLWPHNKNGRKKSSEEGDRGAGEQEEDRKADGRNILLESMERSRIHN